MTFADLNHLYLQKSQDNSLCSPFLYFCTYLDPAFVVVEGQHFSKLQATSPFLAISILSWNYTKMFLPFTISRFLNMEWSLQLYETLKIYAKYYFFLNILIFLKRLHILNKIFYYGNFQTNTKVERMYQVLVHPLWTFCYSYFTYLFTFLVL